MLKRLLQVLLILCLTISCKAQVLNVNDFNCFINRYQAGESWANLDNSTSSPVLNVNDFLTFQNLYAAGDMRADCDVQQTGWTELTLPAGAVAWYVSASSGNDANAGTIQAPFRTLQRGYQALRNGFPDQLLLKAGDTWTEAFPSFNKSANSLTSYMVVGSYGAGNRPKIRTGSGQSAIHGGTHPGKGLAIVDLDMQPTGPIANSPGLGFFQPWQHLLIEGCSIVGYSDNINCQEVGAGRLNDIKIRRCLIADSNNTAQGHSQGIFFGSVDNWLIEECILDNNARPKADIFCHNAYIHETNGPGVFRGNISSRACSHGVQQRPGGEMENNLFLQNPINAYQGSHSLSTGSTTNVFQFNGAIDSRNINSVDVRGIGFELSGDTGSVVRYNFAANQRSGTENVTAFNFNDFRGSIYGNAVYDWNYNNNVWGACYQFDGSNAITSFHDNQAYQPTGGTCLFTSPPTSYYSNRYFSVTPAAFNGMAWSSWQSNETGSTYVNPGNIAPVFDIVAFITEARKQSRQNWREQYTADYANDAIRLRLGVQAN